MQEKLNILPHQLWAGYLKFSYQKSHQLWQRQSLQSRKFSAMKVKMWSWAIFRICCLEGCVGISISSPKHPGYTEQRGGQKPNAFQTSVRGASFTAAAAPKPLLPGNILACCFNKRGWCGGHEEERRKGGEGVTHPNPFKLLREWEKEGERGSEGECVCMLVWN